MPPGYYLAAFLCLFATSIARKSQEPWETADWTQSNTMSKEPGERHVEGRYSDTIDIDNENQGFSIDSHTMSDWPGSGAGHVNDDWGSGAWTDDEDDSDDGFSGYGKPSYRQPTKRPKPGGSAPDEKIVHPNTELPDMKGPDGEKEDIEYKDTKEPGAGVDIELPNGEDEDDDLGDDDPHKGKEDEQKHSVIISTPGLLPGIIGGAVVGLLCAVLLVMFIVYRMRKKDEGSYALEEPKMTSPSRGYTRAPTKEYWA